MYVHHTLSSFGLNISSVWQSDKSQSKNNKRKWMKKKWARKIKKKYKQKKHVVTRAFVRYICCYFHHFDVFRIYKQNRYERENKNTVIIEELFTAQMKVTKCFLTQLEMWINIIQRTRIFWVQITSSDPDRLDDGVRSNLHRLKRLRVEI